MSNTKALLLDQLFDNWDLGEIPKFRTEQVRNWVFEKGVLEWEKMSNLPQSLRTDLSNRFDLTPMKQIQVQGSADSTQKFLWSLRDHQFIESVLIPATLGTKGVRAKRLTLCISTQVGCALGCKFCASGLDGLKRNLSTGEIIGQIILAKQKAERRIDNLVFMGMGEPLANLPALLPALDTILPQGLGLEQGILPCQPVDCTQNGNLPIILLRLAISLMER